MKVKVMTGTGSCLSSGPSYRSAWELPRDNDDGRNLCSALLLWPMLFPDLQGFRRPMQPPQPNKHFKQTTYNRPSRQPFVEKFEIELTITASKA